MAMTEEERILWVLAEEFEGSIRSIFDKVEDASEWVDTYDEAQVLMARMRGIFVASLVGQVEERLGHKFSRVFDQLSDLPTVKGSPYWFQDMPKSSSPRGRAKVMWAVRVAYTDGNGHQAQISDSGVRMYAQPEFARVHFRGVSLERDLIRLSGEVTFPALKTALQILSELGPPDRT